MITQSLCDNVITLNDVKKLIDMSMLLYKTKISGDMSNQNNRRSFLSFLSDDIYEFDCIMHFAKIMLDLNIDSEKWKSIHDEVRQYNEIINNNSSIYSVLVKMLAYYPQITKEHKFINKIIVSIKKTGVLLHQSSINDVNDKINSITNKISTEYNTNIPVVSFTKDELIGMPQEFANYFFDKHSGKYNIKMNRIMYNVCQHNISQSNTREKIDNELYKHYSKNISRLTYLFMYEHVKANILGYDTSLSYMSNYSKENIQELLENIIINLNPRSELELKILSDLKKKEENDPKINTWDIDFYINKWKHLYGVNDMEISQYFELNNTLITIMSTITSLFGIKFARVNKFIKWNDDIIRYTITQNNVTLGHVTFDLYNRTHKSEIPFTACINNRCFYPFETGKISPVDIIMSMNIIKSSPTLLTLSELTTLFNEFGKIIYYVSCGSDYNLFGCIYSDIEYVNAIGKFCELLFFDSDILANISSHYNTNEKLSNELIRKIINHRRLDHGIYYKYQCLFGMYDLFVHSQQNFIDECKKLMKITDTKVQKNKITERMTELYNIFYDTIFNTVNISVTKSKDHYHPVLWSYLFNGNENINFLNILSDVYAYELYASYTEHKTSFCAKLIRFISENINSQTLNIEKLIGHKVSSNKLLSYFGSYESDIKQSIYNLDISQRNKFTEQKNNITQKYSTGKQVSEPHNNPASPNQINSFNGDTTEKYSENNINSLYMSSDLYTENKLGISENNTKINEMLSKVIKK